MGKQSLKNILGRKNDVTAFINDFINKLNANVFVEDETGKLLAGNTASEIINTEPLYFNNELIGFVKGDKQTPFISQLLTLFYTKEAEKRKLGSEILNLYQEVNLMFNFSDKLAQAIEPLEISKVTLTEARTVISADNGVIVLWEEHNKRLRVMASEGDLFFDEEKINAELPLLIQLILSGNSEIITDISFLKEAGIISNQVQSIIYSALKVNHRIMGAVILAGNNPEQYTANDLKLLTTLALQSSAAIESALLYEKNIREAKEKEEAMRRIHDVTKKFVPYEFIQSLGRDVLTDLRLGDQVEKVVTVLFTDIRDYTTLSEQMTPEENFAFVCDFNERMGPIIRKHKGFINQYQGDAIMAIFPDTATGALAAAVEMQQTVREYNRKRKENNQSEIKMGIGMHTGPLIMGITGDNERMDATTISDTVNTASRLESLTKHYKATIILSDVTLSQVIQKENFHCRNLGSVQLKGKQTAVNIYECLNGYTNDEIERKLSTLSLFNDGLQNYLNKSFEPALTAFEKLCHEDQHDHTAKMFLSIIRRYLKEGMPENWAGAHEMSSK